MAYKKRFKRLTKELCEQAVTECFKSKWQRNDVLTFVEKYAGIPREDIKIDDLSGSKKYKNEATEAIGLAMVGVIEDLVDYKIEPEDMEPVTIRQRPDGMTGKIRDIAMLCIMHQLLGHIVKLMIEPLIQARLLPTQHASIPGHGQTMLKDQMRRYFLKESLGIKYIRKTDVVHAYASLQYDVCIDLVKAEIPGARYAIALLEYLKTAAPGGHLIIGGYLDAWLFNFVMSYAIRYLYTLGQVRRGKKTPYVIRCGTFMDDFVICSGSIKGGQRATKSLEKWFEKNQNLQIKKTTGIIKLLSIEEEKRRRDLPRPGQRGVAMLDMAGYRVGRTHITIRRRVFKRVRRQLLRGYKELKRDGTLRRDRAQKLISYNGYIEQSDAYHLQGKYHTRELLQVAHRVNGFYGQLEYQKRMEELHDLLERRCRSEAGKGNDGKSSGWRNDRQDGGQYQGILSGRRKGSEDVPF